MMNASFNTQQFGLDANSKPFGYDASQNVIGYENMTAPPGYSFVQANAYHPHAPQPNAYYPPKPRRGRKARKQVQQPARIQDSSSVKKHKYVEIVGSMLKATSKFHGVFVEKRNENNNLALRFVGKSRAELGVLPLAVQRVISEVSGLEEYSHYVPHSKRNSDSKIVCYMTFSSIDAISKSKSIFAAVNIQVQNVGPAWMENETARSPRLSERDLIPEANAKTLEDLMKTTQTLTFNFDNGRMVNLDMNKATGLNQLQSAAKSTLSYQLN